MTYTRFDSTVKHREGLPHINEKLLLNEPIVVAFLGGSITEGEGASNPNATCYRALTESYLKQRFSPERVTCINAGVGGTTSTFGAHRLFEHVLSQGEIDLVFVEFSVNDGKNRDESICGMEGIVRQCRQHSPRTDICFLYTVADKNLTEGTPFNIAVHEEVASYYGIPSVSFASEVYKLITLGEVQWVDLAPDRVHPNDAGHGLYAKILQAYLEGALVENADADMDKECTNRQEVVSLPPPVDPNNYEYAVMMEVDAADCFDRFEWRNLTSEPLMNWRYETRHLYTNMCDASLSFTAYGQSAGLLLLCGPDTGIFEYAIDEQPYQQVNLFDDWCLKAYRPIITMFPIQAERKSRRITIRHTGMKDERSTGITLRILKLLSNH